MRRFKTIATIGFVSAALAFSLPTFQAHATDPVYTGTFSDLAVDGYDPVAYFTDGKPVEGSSDHELEWNGATWRFSSAANLASFKADPEKFAPQYGGYCAWAIAQGKTASGDPDHWKIVDGKLYLNYNEGIQKRWEGNIPGFIADANQAWPKIVAN